MNFILLLIFGYLLGSISFGYLIPKLKRIDIRKIGSKSTSSTNVSRALGWKWGVLSGILDFLKGVIPAYLAINYLQNSWQIAAVLVAPVAGHIFPIWFGFKGGRGAATVLGVLIVLLGWNFVYILIPWIFILATIKVMSFANLVLAVFLPAVFFTFSPSIPYLTCGIILFLLIWWALRENIKRIKEGVEPKIKFKW